MLAFLGGIDLPGLIIVIVFLAFVGVAIFYIIRPLVRKLFKSQPANIINAVSRLIAVILTPALFVLVVYLIFRYYNNVDEHEFTETEVTQYYEMMDAELNANLKVGMSKSEALAEFALEDTTQSEYEIDLSIPDVKEQYVLKLKFDKGRLTSVERKNEI